MSEDDAQSDYYYWDEPDPCPCCKGQGTVNPLTANLPKVFLCLGTDICPVCEGRGEMP